MTGNDVLVGPMRDVELRRAIERPAQRAGRTFEPGLVDVIVADVAGRPGALPLLSTALAETWERRVRRRPDARWLHGGGRGERRPRRPGGGHLRVTRTGSSNRRPPVARCGCASPGEVGALDVRRRLPLAELGGRRRHAPRRRRARRTTVAGGRPRHRRGRPRSAVARVAPAAGVAGRGRAGTPAAPPSQRRGAGVDGERRGRLRAVPRRAPRLGARLGGHPSRRPHRVRAELRRRQRRRGGPGARRGRSPRRRQGPRQRRLRWSLVGVAALLVVAVVAGLLFVRQRDRAERAAREATARESWPASRQRRDRRGPGAGDPARPRSGRDHPSALAAIRCRRRSARCSERRRRRGSCTGATRRSSSSTSSNDGTRIATGSAADRGAVLIWDAASGEQLRTLPGTGRRTCRPGRAVQPGWPAARRRLLQHRRPGAARPSSCGTRETGEEVPACPSPTSGTSPRRSVPTAADWSPSARAAATRRPRHDVGPARPAARCSRSSWTVSAASPPFLADGTTLVIPEDAAERVGLYSAADGSRLDDIATPGFQPETTALHEASGLLALGSQAASRRPDRGHGDRRRRAEDPDGRRRATRLERRRPVPRRRRGQLEPGAHRGRVDGRGSARPARARERLLGRRVHRRWRAAGQRRLRRRAPRLGRHARRSAGAAGGGARVRSAVGRRDLTGRIRDDRRQRRWDDRTHRRPTPARSSPNERTRWSASSRTSLRSAPTGAWWRR